MSSRFPRILTYLVLALLCYAISTMVGARLAMMVFLLLGGALELMFWKEIFWPKREGSE